MALIVEDGTGVENANSYSGLNDLRAYASARGVTLPSEDPALEVLVIKAMDFLESKRAEYQGSKVFADQSLQFPRTGVYVDSILMDNDKVPTLIKSALAQLCMEMINDPDIMPNSKGYAVRKTTVTESGVSTEFATGENNVAASMPVGTTYAKVEALLRPLLRQGSSIRLVRV
jgi:hypothetical protein